MITKLFRTFRLTDIVLPQNISNIFKEEHHNEELYGKPIKH